MHGNCRYRFIETPLFIAENQFDYEQLFGELKLPIPSNKTSASDVAKTLRYLRYYGERMRESLAQVGTHDDNGLCKKKAILSRFACCPSR